MSLRLSPCFRLALLILFGICSVFCQAPAGLPQKLPKRLPDSALHDPACKDPTHDHNNHAHHKEQPQIQPDQDPFTQALQRCALQCRQPREGESRKLCKFQCIDEVCLRRVFGAVRELAALPVAQMEARLDDARQIRKFNSCAKLRHLPHLEKAAEEKASLLHTAEEYKVQHEKHMLEQLRQYRRFKDEL